MIGQAACCVRKSSVADTLGGPRHAEIVENPVAGDENSIARRQLDERANLDLHLRGTDHIGDQVTVVIRTFKVRFQQPAKLALGLLAPE
jgi:hypothetical protein